jgi:hypothetical protein
VEGVVVMVTVMVAVMQVMEMVAAELTLLLMVNL